jgi:hypothetical protein
MMPTEGQKDITIGRLEGKIDAMSSQVNEIHKALYGNGQAGIENRLTRAEEKFVHITEEREKTRQDLEKILKSVSCLKDLIENHVENADMHTVKGLFFRKEVIPYVILFVVAIHSLLPEGLNLWELIKSIFGF